MQKHQDLIFDVGLHTGEDSDYYLKKGFRVVAFEADSDLNELCRERFRPFINSGQLTIVEGAVVDREAILTSGKVRFFLNSQSSHWGTTRPEWAQHVERDGAKISVCDVTAVNFRDSLETHGVPHYLKIDIEGSDIVCLRALEGFSEKPDYISLESSRDSFRQTRSEIDKLFALGYCRFKAVEQSGLEGVPAPMPSAEGKTIDHTFCHGSSGPFGADLYPPWVSYRRILRAYRLIHFGTYLFGTNGVLYRFTFPGASRCRRILKTSLMRLTGNAVPGWYDTHARLQPPH